MATQYKIYDMQLMDLATSKTIITAGGLCTVCTVDTGTKATLYDPDAAFASLANPVTPVRGKVRFAVLSTVSLVDIALQAPGGEFVYIEDIDVDTPEIYVDTQRKLNRYVLPFSWADSTAATEKDTGYDLPVGSLVLPLARIRVLVLDAGITIEAGLLASETAGDDDGFVDAVSVATAGWIKGGTIVNGANTLGALFEFQDSANAGDLTHESHVVVGANAKSLTYKLSAGADTASGLLEYLVMLP